MLHRIAVDRGVQASVVAGGGLAVLAAANGLVWPIWVAWAIAAAVALGLAVRS